MSNKDIIKYFYEVIVSENLLDEGKYEEALELFLDGCVASDKKAPRYVGYMY